MPNERFIVRSYSPQITISGGKILDGLANKHRRKDLSEIIAYLEKLSDSLKNDNKESELKLFLEKAGETGLSFRSLQAQTGWIDSILRRNLQEILIKKSVIEADGIYLSRTIFDNLAKKTVQTIQSHHQAEPLSRGILRETLREKTFPHLPVEIFKKTLQVLAERGEISAEKDIVRIASYSQNLSVHDKQIMENLQRIYAVAKLEVPTLENALLDAIKGTKSTPQQARKIFQLLLESGEIVKITNDFYFSTKVISELVGKLKNHAAQISDRLIDVPTFKDLAGISRKYAIPLLEYFDQIKITRRAGDKRLIL